MKTMSTTGKYSNLRRSPVAHACLTFSMLLAAGAAQAGAGWGDHFDASGNPIRARTYYAHSPTGDRLLAPCAVPFAADGTCATIDPVGLSNGALKSTGAALRKFIDPLPRIGAAGGTLSDGTTSKYIPLAQSTKWVDGNGAQTTDDYYEIAVVEYKEKMHSDLKNPTTLRGYVQIYPKTVTAPAGAVALTYPDGSAIKFDNGNQVYAYAKPHYLGPAIDAVRGTPVRLKFYNFLPVGHAVVTNALTGAVTRNGDLFVPVDTTLAGAGVGPDGVTNYTQNRALIHMHGGDTPWISDGTPHQWITPAGESDLTNPASVAATALANGGDPIHYIKGDSQQNVPDMPAPEAGAATYYFPNNQRGRMMWYHDHSFGLTRLNVYAGEAAPYILEDSRQDAILNATTVPGFPDASRTLTMVIQDKTFVPADIALQDGLWNNSNANHPVDGKVTPKNIWGSESDMWYPHVYEINQDPSNGLDGTNGVGRWDWGPYFWPVFPSLYNIPSGAVDDVTITPEAWMDTPLVNGVAYPYAEVDPKAYRLKILNAANDRMFNLSMFVADGVVSRIDVKTPGTGYAVGDKVIVAGPPVGTDTTTAHVSSVNGTGGITGIAIDNAGSGYGLSPNILSVTSTRGAGFVGATAAGTEVKMVNAVPQVAQATAACAVDAAGNELPPSPTNQCWPSEWPADGRDGGVPDPLTAGPSWLQIGTEGGLLPQVAQIDAKPMGFEYNRRSITVLNTFTFGLFLGNAERADTVVDFSPFAGKTVIVYNDSPAPVPAFDPRNDHWTGKPDESSVGSVETPRPGFGPNTRTVMQFRVAATAPAAPINVDTLNTKLAQAYGATQEAPIVAQSAYNQAFGKSYSDAPNAATGTRAFANIFTGSLQEPALKFVPGDSNGVFSSIDVVNGGTGYMTPPAVTISAPNAANGVQATAFSSLRITRVAVTDPGSGYVVAPLVRFSNLPITDNNGNAVNDPVTGQPLVAVGDGAQGYATLKVVGLNIAAAGTGYKVGNRLNLTFAAPVRAGGVRAAGYVTVKRVSGTGAITGLNTPVFTGTGFSAGSGYGSAPGVTVAAATGVTGVGVKLTSLAGVDAVILTSPNPRKPELAGGGGYNNLNFVDVVFSTPPGVKTPAVAAPTGGSVFDITLIHKGDGYTTAPTVTVAAAPAPVTPPSTDIGNARVVTPPPAEVRATAAAKAGGSMLVKSKAIQELFDPTYGRMNATLGIELPFTSAMSQTTIPLGYIDPHTEEFDNGETQIWKITHNGVDSHPVHFHLLNVQLINRIGWDGTVKPPLANEVGWKETIKMHPLEDIVVAVRAKKPIFNGELQADGSIKETARSFGLPLSRRLRDPSQPEGSPAGFTQIDPANGLPATIVNGYEDYGWEYVWHCHILGHEENDFMRAVKFNANEAKPAAPSNVVGSYDVNNKVTLTWTDNAVSEYKYQVSRAPAMTAGTVNLLANANTFTDADIPVTGTKYTYTVTAVGAAGSNSATYALPTPPAAPSNFKLTPTGSTLGVNFSYCDNADNETAFQLMRNTGAGYVAVGGAIAAHTGTTTAVQCNGFSVLGVQITAPNPLTGTLANGALVSGAVNSFELIALNGTMVSQPSNVVTVDMTAPAAPASATATANGANIVAGWAAVTGATSYIVELSTDNGTSYTTVNGAATGTSWTTTTSPITSAGGSFLVRVSAVKSIAGSVQTSSATTSPVLTVQPQIVAPSTPANLAATLTNSATGLGAGLSTTENVAVSWTASATGTSPSYTVEWARSTAPTVWTKVAAVTGTSTTFQVARKSGALSATLYSYYFRISATNGAGTSATSALIGPIASK